MFDLFSSSSEMFYHMQVRGDEANKAHVQVNGHEIKDKIQHCMLASVWHSTRPSQWACIIE